MREPHSCPCSLGPAPWLLLYTDTKVSKPFISSVLPEDYASDFILYCHLVSSFFLAPREYLFLFLTPVVCSKNTTLLSIPFLLVIFCGVYIRNKKGASCTGSVHHLNRELAILELNTPFYCVLIQLLSRFFWPSPTRRKILYLMQTYGAQIHTIFRPMSQLRQVSQNSTYLYSGKYNSPNDAIWWSA